jgi:pimeloyl-ACP methyl ester carboxylesterase
MDTSGTIEQFGYKDLQVFYKKAGSGKPVIFLHNGGNSHSIWDHQVDYFSGSHTCYAFDLPGYGLSSNPAARYPLELYTGFVDQFIQSKHLAPVTLVGNCLGSAISLTCAMNKPGSVGKLILFNILTKKTVWNGIWGFIFRLTAPAPSLRELLQRGFRNWTVPGPIVHYSLVRQFGTRGHRDPELVKKLKKDYRRKGPLAALADIVVNIESFAPMDNFTIPEKFPRTLVIWGEKNTLLPVKAGIALCEKLKPDRMEIIPGGGHMVMHELHQEVNGILGEFIGLDHHRADSLLMRMLHLTEGVFGPKSTYRDRKDAMPEISGSFSHHPDKPIFPRVPGQPARNRSLFRPIQ